MVTSRPRPLLPAVAVLVAALVASGCTGRLRRAAPSTTDGGGAAEGAGSARSGERTLSLADGTTRRYRLYVPGTLAAGATVPLLLALHGGLGTAAQFEAASGFDALAASNRFVVAYPDGEPLAGVASLVDGRIWHAGGCCGAAGDDPGRDDDVRFLRALIAELTATLPVDPGRVVLTGHSNGAMMALRMACEAADQVAAVAVQSGTLFVDDCRPVRPVAVLAIHGTADRNVPIDGGTGDRSISGVDYPAPLDGLARLAAADGCPADAVTTPDPVNADVELVAWSPCRDGTVVELQRVRGAGHAWMGSPQSAAQRLAVGPAYEQLDASAVVWSFLASHGRR